MKSSLVKSSLILALAATLGSCSPSRHITVCPSPLTVEAPTGESNPFNLTLHIPGKYIKDKGRVVIVPVLLVGDSIATQFPAIVVDSPKYAAKVAASGAKDVLSQNAVTVDDPNRPIDMEFSGRVKLPIEATSGTLYAIVTGDENGHSVGLEDIKLADVIVPLTSVEDRYGLSWKSHEYTPEAKTFSREGEVLLEFSAGSPSIDPTLGKNAEKLEALASQLEEVFADDNATLQSIRIIGSASPDGPRDVNVALAADRARSARHWLADRLHIPADRQNIITTGARCEGWDNVVAAMSRAGDPDSVVVRHILDRFASSGNDDEAEAVLRTLPSWPRISLLYLSPERSVTYSFTWTAPGIDNDSAIQETFKRSPRILSENELLHLADIAETRDDKINIYETTINLYPTSEIAANNLAILYSREGHEAEATNLVRAMQNAESKKMTRH